MPRRRIQLAIELIRYALNGLGSHGLSASPNPEDLQWLGTKKIDTLAYLATKTDSTVQNVYDRVIDLQLAALKEVVRMLESEGIPVIVFKGAEVVAHHLKGRGFGLFNDLDILVRSEDTAKTKRLLFSAGFGQGIYNPHQSQLQDRDLIEIAGIEGNHYELAPFNRVERVTLEGGARDFAAAWKRHPLWIVENECCVVVELDVHHRVALDIPSSPLFDRAVKSVLPGALTLSPTDHLWFTMGRYYNEVAIYGKTHLRDLAYAAFFVADPSIDWDLIVRIAAELDVRPTLYYWAYIFQWPKAWISSRVRIEKP